MYNKNRYVVKNIKIRSRIKNLLVILSCISILLAVISFFLVGFYSSGQAIKLVAKYKDKKGLKIEKVMINPNIKFEYRKNDFYDIDAKKALHKGEDIVLFDVIANGSEVKIEAGKLVISNNGDDLIFSDNPVLTIKNMKNIQQ